MAKTNGNPSDIRNVLILGDAVIASSISNALTNADIKVRIAPLPAAVSSVQNGSPDPEENATDPLVALLLTSSADLVISTTLPNSFETQKRIVDAAIAAHIPRFIPAEFSSDTINPQIQARLPPARERARTIAYLEQRATQGRISWLALSTGTTLDHGLSSGRLGFDVTWQSATVHGTGRERFAASSTAWIGRAVLAAVRHWDDVQNQYLYATGLTTCADDVVACFERLTGKTWVVGRAEPEDCVREAERRIASGFPDAGIVLMERSVLYDERLGAVRPFLLEDAKGRLGLERERLEDVVRDVIHEIEHHGGKGGCGCD